MNRFHGHVRACPGFRSILPPRCRCFAAVCQGHRGIVVGCIAQGRPQDFKLRGATMCGLVHNVCGCVHV